MAADPSPLSAGLYWMRPSRTSSTASAQTQSFRHGFELLLFAKIHARWEEWFGTHVIVSNPNVVRIADDKYLTYGFFHDHRFAAPASCLPGEEFALIERVGFPLKPHVGARSVGVVKVQTKDKLALSSRRWTHDSGVRRDETCRIHGRHVHV